MCFTITDISKLLIGIRDYRRTLIWVYRWDFLYHTCDLLWIFYNNFSCLRRTKICELLQHFICCAKEQRCLIICVFESFSCHDDPAINFILRIKEMNVTGCYNRLTEFLSKFNNLPVYVTQIFLCIDIRRFLIFEHKHIISNWLDFIIIIEICQSRNLLCRLFFKNRTV